MLSGLAFCFPVWIFRTHHDTGPQLYSQMRGRGSSDLGTISSRSLLDHAWFGWPPAQAGADLSVLHLHSLSSPLGFRPKPLNRMLFGTNPGQPARFRMLVLISYSQQQFSTHITLRLCGGLAVMQTQGIRRTYARLSKDITLEGLGVGQEVQDSHCIASLPGHAAH